VNNPEGNRQNEDNEVAHKSPLSEFADGFWRFMKSVFKFFGDVLSAIRKDRMLSILWGFGVLLLVLLVATFVLARDLSSNAKLLVVGLTVIALVGIFIYTIQQTKLKPPTLVPGKSIYSVEGGFHTPNKGDEVGRQIPCSGWVTGWDPSMNLWLVVEVKSFLWPKRLVVPEVKWNTNIFEDGTENDFDLALWVAGDKGNNEIQTWFETAEHLGEFQGLKVIPGAIRLARINLTRRN